MPTKYLAFASNKNSNNFGCLKFPLPRYIIDGIPTVDGSEILHPTCMKPCEYWLAIKSIKDFSQRMWVGSCKIIPLSSHQTPRHPPISQRSLGGRGSSPLPEKHFSIRQKAIFSPAHFIYIYTYIWLYIHTYSSGIPRWNRGDVIIPSQKMLGKQNGKTVAVANCRFGGFPGFHHVNQFNPGPFKKTQQNPRNLASGSGSSLANWSSCKKVGGPFSCCPLIEKSEDFGRMCQWYGNMYQLLGGEIYQLYFDNIIMCDYRGFHVFTIQYT